MGLKTTENANANVDSRLAAFMAKAGAKDRVNVEKHLTACDAEADPGHGKLCRQLITKLGELAPLAVRTGGSLVAQFYIPDGKYRMQVFALEDKRDGAVVVYLPNVLAQAVKEKILVKKGEQFSVASAPGEALVLEQMDEKHPLNPPEHVKHMTGWNRKAVKLTLQASAADSPQVTMVEQLCDLAARQWAAS
jgi:hypothetical protein